MNVLSFLKKKTDPGDLVSQINTLFERDEQDYARKIIDRIIFRNLLYYVGEQWLVFATSLGAFKRRNIPAYIPTPVSNEIRDFVRTMRSMFMSQKLIPKIFPNTNELEDESAAALGEQLLVWMDQSNDAEFLDEKEKVVDWVTIAGTAFMRTYPKMDSGRWFSTKDGILKEGEVCSEAVIPFNVVLDPMGDSLQKKRWVGIKSLKDKEWVEDTFKTKITTGSGDIQTVDYERRLMKLVSQVSPWKGAGIETGLLAHDEDMVLFREVEFCPTEKYPNGRYIVVCNNQLISDMPRMIIKSEPGVWFYSLTDFHYNRVPGRFWSDSGINDLISPQNTINEIDQMLAMNRKSLGRNRVALPTGVVIKKVNEGGTGFLAFEYDPRTTGGVAPQIMQGTPLPTQIVEERMIQKVQFQDSAGDPKNILKGQAPSAQSSGVQVDILRETAERSHYPDTDRFNRSLNRVYKKRLLLAQEVYTESRVLKIVGKGNKVEIKQFLGADLKDNTDVKLELDNGLSTTRSGQLQLLMDMATKGYLGNLEENPELRSEFLQRAGLSGFSEHVNADISRAERENSAIAMGSFENIFLLDDEQEPEMGPDGQPMPVEPQVLQFDPLFSFDNHVLHTEQHRRCLVSAEYRDWKPEAKQVLLGHTLAHKKSVEIENENNLKRPSMSESASADRIIPLLTQKEVVGYLPQLGIVPDQERLTNPDAAPKIIPSNADKVAEKQIDHQLHTDREQTKAMTKMAEAEHKEKLAEDSSKRDFVVSRAEAEHDAVLTEEQERIKTERALALEHAKNAREKKDGKPIPSVKGK